MAVVSRDIEGRVGGVDLAEIYRVHYDAVYRVCRGRLGVSSDAEDATQEVFCRAVIHGDDLVGDALPWLLRTATNLCTDIHRRRAIHGREMELDPESHRYHKEDNPERLVVGRMAVSEMISCLTTSEKEVVLQKWLLDRTHTHAGTMLGVSTGTTKKLLSRARHRLVAYVEQRDAMVGSVIFASLQNLVGRLRLRRSDADNAVLVERLTTIAGPALVAAALVLSVGGAGPATSRGGGDTVGLARVARSNPTGDGNVAGTSFPVGPRLAAAGQESAPMGAPAIGPLLAINSPAGIEGVGTTDIAASPDYASDHRVFAVGVRTNCAQPPCGALFRSDNGGASWHQLRAEGLTGTQLLLPEAGIGAGRFYAFGSTGLQVTTDGGASFRSLAAYAYGFAAAAPAWRPAQVAVSNADIWDYGVQSTPAGGLPTLDGTLPAGYHAVGAALFTANRLTFQPAIGPRDPLSHTQVLRCSQTCGSPVALPWAGFTNLRLSPNFSYDGMLGAIVQGRGIAVSRDGGGAYHAIAAPGGGFLADLAFIEGAGRTRLVALESSAPATATVSIVYSDDMGQTWMSSRLVNVLSTVRFSQLHRLAPAQLIVATDDGAVGGSNGFACSRDGGATWRDCAVG